MFSFLFWRVHPQDIFSKSPCGNDIWGSSVFLLYWSMFFFFFFLLIPLFCSLLSCQWPLHDLAQCLYCFSVLSAVSRIMLLVPCAQRHSSQMSVGAQVTHSSFLSVLPSFQPCTAARHSSCYHYLPNTSPAVQTHSAKLISHVLFLQMSPVSFSSPLPGPASPLSRVVQLWPSSSAPLQSFASDGNQAVLIRYPFW